LGVPFFQVGILVSGSPSNLAWLSTSDGRTRIAFAWAIAASVALAFGATLMSLCTLESNASRYVERCASGSYEWPLLGIPILLALALFGRSLRGLTLWLIGAVVFLAALAVPFFWLTTAR
jgi:hypothetical protein